MEDVIYAAIGLLLLFGPGLVASKRRRKQANAIFFLSLVGFILAIFGFPVVGLIVWAVSLYWALSKKA